MPVRPTRPPPAEDRISLCMLLRWLKRRRRGCVRVLCVNRTDT